MPEHLQMWPRRQFIPQLCLTPQVPGQLKAAFLRAVDEGRMRSMQNKSMPAVPLHRPGALLLGGPPQSALAARTTSMS